jgi:rRNA maturation RNase YbeY
VRPLKTSLQIVVHAAIGKDLVPGLRRKLRAAHGLIPRCALRELSLALVPDPQMKRLHKKYLGINSTTDVLTFELDHDSRGRVTGGEVVVCVPQARRQRHTNTEGEVLLCALHGMLHLCGFDDKTKRQFAAMHRTEDRLLSRLGVGPVFSLEDRAKGGASRSERNR